MNNVIEHRTVFRSKLKHVTYLGMQGTGETLAKAKADAEAKIEQALRSIAAYEPHVVTVGDVTQLVWLTPFGYNSGRMENGQVRCTCMHGTGPLEKILAGVRAHTEDIASQAK